MQPPQNSHVIQSTLGVLALCACVYAGLSVRERVDKNGNNAEINRMDGFLASTHADTKDVPLVPYYQQVVQILKDRYVDPIKDDQKLASGAVRGMINGLNEAHTHFYDPEEFKVFENIDQSGTYEGIGVNTIFDFGNSSVPDEDPSGIIENAGIRKIPKLVISAVAHGSSAEQAGLKPGDQIDTIDGHWIVNPELIEAYRKLAATTTNPDDPKLAAARKDLRAKGDSSIMPNRAWDRLMEGKSGTTQLVIRRPGQAEPLTLSIPKGVWKDSGNVVDNGALRLRFNSQAPEFLASQLAGKTEVTIDLRSITGGNFDSMKKCLALVAPTGDYGVLRKGKKRSQELLTLASGASTHPKLTILVDQGTRGAAQIFALALSGKGLAVLSGGPMVQDRVLTEVEGLPDGSGFSLATGFYQASANPTRSATSKGANS